MILSRDLNDSAGLSPIREIRENFEDFSGQRNQGKRGVFSQNQGEKFKMRELFFGTIFGPFNLRKMLFKAVKTFFRSCQEIALNKAIFA